MKYIIQDWAGNVINYDGQVLSQSFAVPMEFTSFEDAVEYLEATYEDEAERGEFEIIEVRENE